jgi:hypothetical protein
MNIKLAVAVLFVASLAVACPSGSYEWNGNCVVDLQPEKDTTPSVKPSDERPSRHPEPAWQRGEVHADILPLPGKDPVAKDSQAEKAQQ